MTHSYLKKLLHFLPPTPPPYPSYMSKPKILMKFFFFKFLLLLLFFLKIKYSPRRCAGIGLSDGEGMERLWSYLRRFCRMRKEMRPSHRIDLVEHWSIMEH